MSETRHDVIMTMRAVGKVYETGAEPFEALRNINLEVRAGEFLGITGKSGAGKTTLLNMLSGVSDITSGDVLFTGKDGTKTSLKALNEDRKAQWRGENMGIVYQSFELLPALSLIENVMLPPDFGGHYHRVGTPERALELLAMVEIVEHAHKVPAHISGGQKQRVAIARALVNDPAIIIADEPTGNLDSKTAATIIALFKRLVAEGRTVVMVTHDESIASQFTRRLHIVDGELTPPPANRVSISDMRDAVESAVPDEPTNGKATLALTNEQNGTGSAGNEPAIRLRDVHRIYESAAGRFVALQSVDLDIDYGRFVSVVGKSGSGKSTLINMISGIDHPTSGEVVVGNEHIYRLSESKRALWRGRNLGIVFQFFQLLPTLTLLENTVLPMDYCNVYRFDERMDRALELLDVVGLAEHADKLPAAVSSGQQQSAAVARAMATDPALILADEPTGNLDARSAEVVLSLFRRLADAGKTVLIVTHDPSITRRTDETIVLADGQIIERLSQRAIRSGDTSAPELVGGLTAVQSQPRRPTP